MAIMTAQQFMQKAKDVEKTKTVYMWGTYGKPLTNALIDAKAAQYPKYNTPARVAYHKTLVGKGYSAWDCVGLIKGILWGWQPGKDVPYRGNTLVPDTGSDGMIKLCTHQSENFKTIVPGAVVWKTGHIGIYIGNGLVVEATSMTGADRVVTTYLSNLGKVNGYVGKSWTRHGRLPWVDYNAVIEPEKPVDPNQEFILHKVVKGDTPWGLSVKYYGNGNRYREIMDYNKLKHTSNLYTWQTLKIPMKKDDTPPVEEPPKKPTQPIEEIATITHVVKLRDTPWGLAEQYLNDGRKYKEIMQFNKLDPTANIYVNQKLLIPIGKHYVHIVKKGDTPWDLAKTYLGNGNRYREIMDLNGLSTTAHIKVGQRLYIPSK